MTDRASFTRDLAQALREADEQPSQTDDNDRQHQLLLRDTYQRLCHDDPQAVSAEGAQLLRQALTDSQSRAYALCPRLVAGIRAQCARSSNNTTTTTTQNDDESLPNEEGEHEPLFPAAVTTNDDTAAAVAQLAWTVHAHIPLLCCRSNDLVEAVGYLGSFADGATEPEPRNNEDDNNEPHDDDAHVEAILEAHGVEQPQNGANGHDPAANGANLNGNQHNDETGSLAEVFAAESDDSDYEFESDFHPDRSVHALRTWASVVQESWDPIHLSKPSSSRREALVRRR